MYTLKLPRLGQTMEEGTIDVWIKQVGESFSVGDDLYEVETEKVTTTVEAKRDGRLVRILVGAGERVPIHTPIAVAVEQEEQVSEGDIDAFLSERSETAQSADLVRGGEGTSSSAAMGSPGVGEGDKRPVAAMPRARALAREAGLSLDQIDGSGHDGAITVGDVEAALSKRTDGNRGPAVPAPEQEPQIRERRRLSGIHRSMAETVYRSWRDVPQFVQQVWVDASAMRNRLEGLRGGGTEESSVVELNYTDLLIDGIVQALQVTPEVNSSYLDGELVIYEDVNVSLAINTSRGLVAPVIARAQAMSLEERALARQSMVDEVRSTARSVASSGRGTITLSNLGMFDVDTGVPIVTQPQAAIVFAGRIQPRPWVIGHEIEIRPILGLAIAYDHRAVDGAAAAGFTAGLREALENS